MEKIRGLIIEKIKKDFRDKKISVLLAWEKDEDLLSENSLESTPAFIENEKDAEKVVWDEFCINNLSKYLLKELQHSEKVGIILKGCDALGFNQLVNDNRIDEERVITYGVPCSGMVDLKKVNRLGLKDEVIEIERIESGYEIITKSEKVKVSKSGIDFNKCLHCENKNVEGTNEFIGEPLKLEKNIETGKKTDKFQEVKEIEAMSHDERYEYWISEFKKCIRCNACRNVCPSCNCLTCVFDDSNTDVLGKANTESETGFYQLIRAYHIAGRCTQCGECERICPMEIPLGKLNKKIIKDLDELYEEKEDPLIKYQLDDMDTFTEKGGKK